MNTYTKKEDIEKNLIEYNRIHYGKVLQTPIYNDRICDKLQKDKVRDQILKGMLEEEECDHKNVYRFLSLLQIPEGREISIYFEPIIIEEW